MANVADCDPANIGFDSHTSHHIAAGWYGDTPSFDLGQLGSTPKAAAKIVTTYIISLDRNVFKLKIKYEVI